MTIVANVRNLKTGISQEIHLSDMLKSYTSSNGARIENYYEIDGRLWAIYVTVFKNETDFEQILIPKNSLFRTSNDTYYAYFLTGKVNNADFRHFEVFHLYDQKIIKEELKLFTTPFSNWDYIVINNVAYQFESVTQNIEGKMKITVDYSTPFEKFYSSYGITE